MGTFSVPIQVADTSRGVYASMDALVDTGSTYSALPRDVLASVGVTAEESRTFELGDDSITEFPVGYASVRLAGREVNVLVVFGPEGVSPLLGATTLEMASLAVDPIRKLLVPVNALLKLNINGGSPDSNSSNGVS